MRARNSRFRSVLLGIVTELLNALGGRSDQGMCYASFVSIRKTLFGGHLCVTLSRSETIPLLNN